MFRPWQWKPNPTKTTGMDKYTTIKKNTPTDLPTGITFTQKCDLTTDCTVQKPTKYQKGTKEYHYSFKLCVSEYFSASVVRMYEKQSFLLYPEPDESTLTAACEFCERIRSAHAQILIQILDLLWRHKGDVKDGRIFILNRLYIADEGVKMWNYDDHIFESPLTFRRFSMTNLNGRAQRLGFAMALCITHRELHPDWFADETIIINPAETMSTVRDKECAAIGISLIHREPQLNAW